MVVVVLPPHGDLLLTRPLLYTAVSRARDLLVLVAPRKAVTKCLRDLGRAPRTMLPACLAAQAAQRRLRRLEAQVFGGGPSAEASEGGADSHTASSGDDEATTDASTEVTVVEAGCSTTAVAPEAAELEAVASNGAGVVLAASPALQDEAVPQDTVPEASDGSAPAPRQAESETHLKAHETTRE